MFPDHVRPPRSDTLGDRNPFGEGSWRRVALLLRVLPCLPGLLRRSPSHLDDMGDARLEVMSGHQVSDLLQVSVRTLEEWRQAHKGPPWRRVGKHVRYLRAEVEAWFEGLDSHA